LKNRSKSIKRTLVIQKFFAAIKAFSDDDDYGKELETMSFDTNMSMSLSFQPNSVTAQGRAGLTVRSFGMPMRQITMLMAGCTQTSLGYADTNMGMTMVGGTSWNNGILGIDHAIGRNTEGSDTLAPRYEKPSQRLWFKDYHFFKKATKGKHYSRPDGLPLSPPPKQRRRCEKEGGVAES
jgi:hypothetical protein